ncbi:MAG: hypothetical protein OEZ51_05070 [Nitrospinota bacterium]|nr:hypothetical protein [Nitrospinota bacterium]
MKRRNARVSIVIFCILLFSNNLFAAPRPSAELFHDLQEYTHYLEGSTGLYNELTEIFTQASSIDDLSQAVLMESINETDALERKRKLGILIEEKFKSASGKLGALYQPNFKTQRFNGQVDEFNNYLEEYSQTIRQSIDDSYNLFEASLTRDLSVVNQFDLRSRRTIIRALEGENALLKLRMAQLEQNNPSYHLFKSIVHSNQSLVYLIKARIAEIEVPEVTGVSNYVPEDGASFVKIASMELDSSKKAVEQGADTLNSWAETNKFKFNISQDFKKIFQSLILSFDNSFKVELQINNAFQTLLNEYPGDESFETVNVQIDTLIDKRMNLQSDRIQLVAQISNLGKTMSSSKR